MATPVFLLLLLAMAFRGSDGAWCVCRADASDSDLQRTLDYACGHGADCAAVLPTGPCYSPTTVRAHCSFAANSYFQRNSQAKGATCDFGGTANLTDTDPSSGTCKYPATPSEAGTSGNSTGTGTSSPGSTSNPATTPSTGGSFTTPVGAFGPVPSTVSAGTAAAFAGRHVLLLAVVSVLVFLAR
ncbi:plasmodesmata callose-binding protein 3 [Dichanthelium oligosanthes]|uniref:Plasmodesmata callose-binding protein 3 n=1 Tax=Dichanthelium oligosanthes TaxID=888268 RepID=A0A1E5WN73_9POAL|nr:plasmodesmata callose-binding protein 3 [Dichanthelium oligosanthes]